MGRIIKFSPTCGCSKSQPKHLMICRRDMSKTDLDDNYKALCNNKHPIEYRSVTSQKK